MDTLEAWEINLLRHTTLFVDPYNLCDALSSGLKGGSDGSVQFYTEGAFGWMLSTNQGESVTTGMGPVQGTRPQSYCAEACGMLSFLWFLIRVAEFTAMLDPWNGQIVTDSQSVLKISEVVMWIRRKQKNL